MELTFLGAAREVTGSCYLLRCGGATVLIECGLIQGTAPNFAMNPTQPVKTYVQSH